MSLRYTAAAGMEQPALRDIEPNMEPKIERNVERNIEPRSGPRSGPPIDAWKDRIEVRLDNRQVFFLFFGSAVVACMLFVLGVIVGKRIESRGRAEAPEVQDPLAALDRASQPPPAPGAPRGGEELTFQKALIGNAPRAKAAAARPPSVEKDKDRAQEKDRDRDTDKDRAKMTMKGKYTLHLGTFATKDEADAFAAKYAAEGAFVVAGDATGKGGAYRVRCGNYASYQEAVAAKNAFEKQNRTIALVAAR
jgi:DedD protein